MLKFITKFIKLLYVNKKRKQKKKLKKRRDE